MKENYDLAKWLAGEMTQNELDDFKKTPEYNTYSKIETYSSQLKAPLFEESQLYKNILKNNKTKIIPFYRNWFFKIAAIVILFLSVTFVMRNFITETQSATIGKRTSFTLPDNSEVVLNSDSEIDYKKWNWSENRKLTLKGEAFFKVAKGKRFEVTTPLGKVTVLGTQFDVKARKNRFNVTCFTGKVKVNYKHKEIILTPGKSVTFENELQINSKVALTKPDWLDNKIAFNKESLKYLIDEIQRQYDVSIEIRTNHPDDLFTGKIPTDNLDIALEIIATAYHFKTLKVTPNKIIFEEK